MARRTRTSSIGGLVMLSSQMRGTPGHGAFSMRRAGFFSSRGSDCAANGATVTFVPPPIVPPTSCAAMDCDPERFKVTVKVCVPASAAVKV